MHLNYYCISILLTSIMFTGCTTTKDIATSKIRTDIAMEHIRLGNIDSAKNALDEALKIHPNNPQAHMILGLTYQLSNTPENINIAETHFKRAINISPSDPQIHNNYGLFLFSNGRFKEAITHFKVSSSTIGYSNRENALNNLGQTYLKLEDYIEAKSSFLRALQINSKHPDALIGLSEAAFNLEDYDLAEEAITDYTKIIPTQKHSPRAILVQININKRNGNLIAMRDKIEQLRTHHPKIYSSQNF